MKVRDSCGKHANRAENGSKPALERDYGSWAANVCGPGYGFFLFFLLVSDCAADDAGRDSNLAKLEKWKKNSGKVSWAANDLFAGLRWICPDRKGMSSLEWEKETSAKSIKN